MITCPGFKSVYKVFGHNLRNLECGEIHDQDVLNILFTCLCSVPSQGIGARCNGWMIISPRV